jgi:multidrug resistance protein, MATE family
MTKDGRLAELLTLAWPVVLARIGIMTMGLTDAVVVGQYSADQLAYHGLGWAVSSTVLTTAIGLLAGVQVMTARYVGEGREDATGLVLRRGLAYAAGIGVVSAAALYLFGPAMLLHAGLDPALARGAGAALQVFALSLPLYLVWVPLLFWLEALEKPVPGMLVMLLANLVNLALNLWLVPGGSGLPVEGAVASAWATFGARVILLAALVGYILWWSGSRARGVFTRQPDDGRAAEQRQIGYGAGASYFVEAGAFGAMTFIAGWLAPLDVAGWTIVLNVAAMIFMVPLGLGSATAVLVGRDYGARDRAGLIRSGNLGFVITAGFLTLLCGVVWGGADLIARAYTADPALIALVVPALLLSCLFFVADGLQVVGANALRARGDIVVPTVTHVISYAVVMLPLAYLLALPLGLGLNGIVWAVVAASLLAASFLLGRFAWLAKRPLPA